MLNPMTPQTATTETSILATHEPVMDQNYNWTTAPIPPKSRIARLEDYARTWERNAADHEASADRRAAREDHQGAAANLATAVDYRRMADQARAEAKQIRGTQA